MIKLNEIIVVRWFFSEKPDQILSQLKYAPTGVGHALSGGRVKITRHITF